MFRTIFQISLQSQRKQYKFSVNNFGISIAHSKKLIFIEKIYYKLITLMLVDFRLV